MVINVTCVVFQFLGNTEVEAPKGTEVVKDAVRKLKVKAQTPDSLARKKKYPNAVNAKIEIKNSEQTVAVINISPSAAGKVPLHFKSQPRMIFRDSMRPAIKVTIYRPSNCFHVLNLNPKVTAYIVEATEPTSEATELLYMLDGKAFCILLLGMLSSGR